MTGGKALHDEINDRMRTALRELMNVQKWDQTRAGAELKVTQQSISQFLSRTTGASLHLAWEIAKASRKTLDELLTGRPDGRATRFEELPGWREHEGEARRQFAHVSSAAFEAVRGWRAEDPPRINAMVIGKLAESWWISQQIPETSKPVVSPRSRKARAG